MSVVVPDEILSVTRMTEAEMHQEIAVMLFQREKLTLAQASRFAGMYHVAFQHLIFECLNNPSHNFPLTSYR